MTVGSCGLHFWVAQRLQFLDQNIVPCRRKTPLATALNEIKWAKRQKNADFRPLRRNISETMGDNDYKLLLATVTENSTLALDCYQF